MGPSVLYLKPTVRIKVGSAAHQKISGELAVMPKDERIEEIKNRAALPKVAPSFGALHGKYAKTLEGINVPVCLTAYGGAENYRTASVSVQSVWPCPQRSPGGCVPGCVDNCARDIKSLFMIDKRSTLGRANQIASANGTSSRSAKAGPNKTRVVSLARVSPLPTRISREIKIKTRRLPSLPFLKSTKFLVMQASVAVQPKSLSWRKYARRIERTLHRGIEGSLQC